MMGTSSIEVLVMDSFAVSQTIQSLVQLGAFICLSVAVITFFVGSYWLLFTDFNLFEVVLQLLNVLLVYGGCIVLATAVFAFAGFIADAIFDTGQWLARGGAVLGVLLGVVCGRFVQKRATL
ncbi:MAG: hypothetical protein H6665_01345 [Ardenticatenaceae bacterium]|nr:hypothetical protein [Ardenticatenaceae bacterium]MCB8989237.1 hypothetical protein [Ardenticatenaceae bacterium]